MPNQPTEDELQEAVELRVTVTRLYRMLRSKSRTTLTASQVSALIRVEEEGPLRLSYLAEREGIAAPRMSKLVDSLCEEGLIERIPDVTDGRANLIKLDDQGQVLLEEVRSRVTSLLRDVLAQLSVSDYEKVQVALPVLQQVVEIIRRDSCTTSAE